MFLAYFWRLKRFAFQRAKGKVAIEVIIYRDQSRPKLQKNKCMNKFFHLFRWVYKIFDFLSKDAKKHNLHVQTITEEQEKKHKLNSLKQN